MAFGLAGRQHLLDVPSRARSENKTLHFYEGTTPFSRAPPPVLKPLKKLYLQIIITLKLGYST
jgi:hypothetical protein